MSRILRTLGGNCLFLRTLVAVWCAATAAGASASDGVDRLMPSATTESPPSPWKPHILMIVMDDLGSHDLGIHGSGIQTPNANALANSGVYLDHYYVLPYCSPTRAALLSGKYPLHTGIHNVILPESAAGLPLEEETLADLLRRAGYRTHAIGKWHIGHSSWAQTPTFRGFDEFYGFYWGGEDYFTHAHGGGYDFRYDRRPRCGKGCSRVATNAPGYYSTPLFARETIRMMEEHVQFERKEAGTGAKPLFQYLAFQAVHCPNEVPQPYIDLYANHTEWTERRRVYAGMLTAADEAIGRVVEAYKAAGIWNDTLVVFTTDNGGPTTFGCIQGSSNYPRRGGKCSLWEGGTTGDGFLSGPALDRLLERGSFSGPEEDHDDGGLGVGARLDASTEGAAGAQAPQRFPHLFHVVDWFPTLAEWVGVVPRNADALDGVSQVGSLARGEGPSRNELFMGYAYMRLQNGHHWFGPGLRHLNWKVVQGGYAGPDELNPNPEGTPEPVPGGEPGSSYLLYDLDQDPLETMNLADAYPGVLRDMVFRLRVYQRSFVPQQVNDGSDCPFPGFANYSVGPTWEPWCDDDEQRRPRPGFATTG